MQSYSQMICLYSVIDNIKTSANNLNKDLKRIINIKQPPDVFYKKISIIFNATIEYIIDPLKDSKNLFFRKNLAFFHIQYFNPFRLYSRFSSNLNFFVEFFVYQILT